MKIRLLSLLLVLTKILTAQTFTEMTGTPFAGVKWGSIAFSDVNGDGHDDVLITGRKIPAERIAKLYTNDGTGIFTEMTGTPFDGVQWGSIAFSDVNGDGHNDVLITGENSSLWRITKLYTNDGTGIFTEMTGTPLDSVYNSCIAFSDVNGDGHKDVLITGVNRSAEQIAKLYTNDGTGTFTEMMGTPFDPVWFSSIAFSDVNGDGHEDVLITGENSSLERVAKLYTNDGTGIFTEMTGTPFTGVHTGSIAFSDVNGDGYDDVLITGDSSYVEPIAKLYTNDGTGTFTEMTGTPFDAVWFGSIAFSDVNGDGHDDVLITGKNSSLERVAKLYTNDGTGTFTEMTGTPFDGVDDSSIAFSDVNGDGHDDVLITGQNSAFELIAKLYINDGGASSIEDINNGMSPDFILFPNPSTPSTLFLSYHSTEMSEVTIKIYNANGILQGQQKEFVLTGQQTFSIDIATLSKGAYSLELDNGKRKGVAKFIVQ